MFGTWKVLSMVDKLFFPWPLMLFLLLYHPLLLCVDIVNKIQLRWWDISAGIMFHSLYQQSYQETDFSFLDLTKEAGMLWDFPVERDTWKGSERILQQMASEKKLASSLTYCKEPTLSKTTGAWKEILSWLSPRQDHTIGQYLDGNFVKYWDRAPFKLWPKKVLSTTTWMI